MFLEKFIPLYSRLLPPTCVLCGLMTVAPYFICQACQKDLPILSHSCRKCAQILSENAEVCGLCLRDPPPFERTYALFPYQPPITQLIIRLKFEHQLSIAQAFSSLFTRAIKTDWYHNRPLPDVIIPIPLHPERLSARGFNQALEIIKPCAKALAIPINRFGATRLKATAAQSSLPARLRKQNMRQAFHVQGHYEGLSIAVVDDVMTTGHTMAEFCRALKAKGVRHIDVWCGARSIPT